MGFYKTGIVVIIGFLFMAGSVHAQENVSGQEAAEAVQENTSGQQDPSSSGILQIQKSIIDPSLFSIELKGAELSDVFRVIARDHNLNVWIHPDVQGQITISLTKISLDEALAKICKMHNLFMEKKDNMIIVRPDLITRVFDLENIEAKDILGSAAGSDSGVDTGAQGGQGASQSNIYNLLSSKGKIYAGKTDNSVMVIDYYENIERIAEYIKMADRGLTSQVFKLKYIKAKEVVGKSGTQSSADPSGAVPPPPGGVAP